MKFASSFALFSFAFFITSCGTAETTAPTLNSATLIITANPEDSSQITVSWTAAEDNATPAAALRYQVLYSSSDNISTLDEAEENGSIALDYTANVTTTTIDDLSPSTTYFVNVIVKDLAMNRSIYTSGSTTTASDDMTAPTLDDASLTLNFGTDPLTETDVTWNAATDETSAQANLQYKLVYSTSNNISTLETAEANGSVGLDFTANVTAATVSGLDANTLYFYNVIVKDEAGNKTLYTSNSQTTAGCFVADTLITMADGSLKAIQDIEVGDRVRSFSSSGDIGSSLVGETYAHDANEYLRIKTNNGTVEVTKSHPFFTGGSVRIQSKYPKFQNIGDFQTGDSVYRLDSEYQELVFDQVFQVETIQTPTRVYNFHISKGEPTYFANSYAVHNK